jgi:DNA-directed RNA polymerase sigma subunit (sigma70/sigma32)
MCAKKLEELPDTEHLSSSTALQTDFVEMMTTAREAKQMIQSNMRLVVSIAKI